MKDSGDHGEKQTYDAKKTNVQHTHFRIHIYYLFPLAYNDRQYGNLKSPQCKIQTTSKVNTVTNFWFTLKLLTIFFVTANFLNEQTTLNKST